MSDEKKSNKNDLFHNSMVDSAMKALTPEQLDEYEKVGQYMFKTDFAHTKGPNPEKEMKDAIFYIKEGLKSGVHPEDLQPKELQIMYDIYGDEWYTEYGYYKDEVPPNPTLGSELGNIAKAKASDHLTPSQINESTAPSNVDKPTVKKRRKKRHRFNKHR